jgi:hypothetical protein
MPQGTGPVTIETTPGPEGNSDLRWASEAGGQAVFTLVAPAVKVLIGDPAGRSVELGDVEVAVEPNPRNHVTLALTSMDDRPTRTSESLLLAAVDKCENPGLKWNEPRTFAGESWEHGPVETWAITATVSITTDAPALAVYALDETGARRSAIESTLANGRLTFRISPAERTIWYEIAKP